MGVKYPITISLGSFYRGSNAQKLAEQARKIEDANTLSDWLNQRAKETNGGILTYGEITERTGFSKELLRELLMPLGGGSHGITFDPN